MRAMPDAPAPSSSGAHGPRQREAGGGALRTFAVVLAVVAAVAGVEIWSLVAHNRERATPPPPPSPATVAQREGGVAARRLNDGREYRIVKVFHEPAALAARLASLGFTSHVVHTPRYFIHGAVTR